jgi:hypothetical protein
MNRLNKTIFMLITVSMVFFLCNGLRANTVYKQTEFDFEPRKIIPLGFIGMNFRGRDYMSTGEAVKLFGFGVGFLYNINIDPSWRGHKFLYSYLDVEFQQENNSARLDETMKPIFVTNPGLMVRTFIPYMKIFYGTGISLRFGSSDFEKWGIYAQAGLEFWGFFLAARMVGSPGEAIINNEIRFGYMHVPSKKNYRR